MARQFSTAVVREADFVEYLSDRLGLAPRKVPSHYTSPYHYLTDLRNHLIAMDMMHEFVNIESSLCEELAIRVIFGRKPKRVNAKCGRLRELFIDQRYSVEMKLKLLAEFRKVPSEVWEVITSLNKTRNLFAHRFSADTRAKPALYRGARIVTRKGFERYQADMKKVSEFFYLTISEIMRNRSMK